MEASLPAADSESARLEQQRRHDEEKEARKKLAGEIADELGETTLEGRRDVYVLLKLQGEPFVREHLGKAREVEASGGMLVKSGERRRTFGGVFFFLAQQALGFKAWSAMFPPWWVKKKQKKRAQRPPARGAAEAAIPPAPAEGGASETPSVGSSRESGA